MLTGKCKILHLSLKKNWFDLMVSGEKKKEFRSGGSWIRSRLYDKNDYPRDYDFIKFVNGYGKDKPYFICEYIDFVECYMDVETHEYSDGSKVEGIGKGDFIIYCGDIIEKGNLINTEN